MQPSGGGSLTESLAPRLVPPAVPALVAGEIPLFALALDLPPRQLAALEPSLSATELARADRFQFARDRERYVAARGQLRTILGRYLDRDAGELRLDPGQFGKPALGIMTIQQDEELGVDVEQVRPFGDALAIA